MSLKPKTDQELADDGALDMRRFWLSPQPLSLDEAREEIAIDVVERGAVSAQRLTELADRIMGPWFGTEREKALEAEQSDRSRDAGKDRDI